MTTCLDCPKPARARGLCRSHYDARRAAGTLPPVERREPLEPIAFRVPLAVKRALATEARRERSTIGAVAARWLTERAQK